MHIVHTVYMFRVRVFFSLQFYICVVKMIFQQTMAFIITSNLNYNSLYPPFIL
jgi:hypothetical protein